MTGRHIFTGTPFFVAARQMYDAACQRLGVRNELEEAESQG